MALILETFYHSSQMSETIQNLDEAIIFCAMLIHIIWYELWMMQIQRYFIIHHTYTKLWKNWDKTIMFCTMLIHIIWYERWMMQLLGKYLVPVLNPCSCCCRWHKVKSGRRPVKLQKESPAGCAGEGKQSKGN